MTDYYNMIKRARETLATAPKATRLQDTTVIDYLKKTQRLRKRGERHGGALFDGAIAEALTTTKKTSWQASRAALLFSIRTELAACLYNQDMLQRGLKAKKLLGVEADWEPWMILVERVDECSRGLRTLLDARLPLEGRAARHTKRQDMKGLPKDWRERVIKRMPTYAPSALAVAITGCRPAELVAGIQWIIRDGMLVAHIKGAKVDVAAGKGQEWREMAWSLDHENGMVQLMIEWVRDYEGEMTVKVDSASNFSKAMSNAAAREWPQRKASITPYCFRHQVAADMKAAGTLDSGEISAALGHLSDLTKSTYGHANMSKGRGAAPARVSAARVVKVKEIKVKARGRNKGPSN